MKNLNVTDKFRQIMGTAAIASMLLIPAGSTTKKVEAQVMPSTTIELNEDETIEELSKKMFALDSNATMQKIAKGYNFEGNNDLLVFNVSKNEFKNDVINFNLKDNQKIIVNFTNENQVSFDNVKFSINGDFNQNTIKEKQNNIILNFKAKEVKYNGDFLVNSLITSNSIITDEINEFKIDPTTQLSLMGIGIGAFAVAGVIETRKDAKKLKIYKI